jgi:NAD(P)-dependent dehydrogenase (short-subunit alcohol dehydrogenase family)
MMSRLQGKTAVVTGGGSGIGLGAARRFVDEGAFVYIFGRRQEALDAALAQLGSSARAIRGSVTDLSDLDRLYEAVKAERGSLDVLFANAGTGAFAPLGGGWSARSCARSGHRRVQRPRVGTRARYCRAQR